MKLMMKKILLLGLVLSCSLGGVFGINEERGDETQESSTSTPSDEVKKLINKNDLTSDDLIKAIVDGGGIVPKSTLFSRKRTRTEVLRSTKGNEGNTLMHKAAELDSPEAMQAIVAGFSFSEKEHPLNQKNTKGNTPFHIAVKKNSSKFLKEAFSLYSKTTRSLFGLRFGGKAAVQRALMMKNDEGKSVFDLAEERTEERTEDNEIKTLIAPYKPMSRLKKAMYAGAGIAGVGLTVYGIYQLSKNPEVQKLYQQALRSGYFKDIKSFIKAGLSIMGTAYIKSSSRVQDYVNALREFVKQRGREVVAKAIARMDNLIASLNWQTSPSDAARVVKESANAAADAINAANPEGVTQITDKFLGGITSAVESIKHPDPDTAVALMNEAQQVLENAKNSFASLPVGSSAYDVATRSAIIDTILDASDKLYKILKSVFGEESVREFYAS